MEHFHTNLFKVIPLDLWQRQSKKKYSGMISQVKNNKGPTFKNLLNVTLRQCDIQIIYLNKSSNATVQKYSLKVSKSIMRKMYLKYQKLKTSICRMASFSMILMHY